MTLQIDRLSLRLPRGFQHRAAGIARRIGQALAEARGPLRGGDALRLPPVRIMPHTSDREIADGVARRVRASGDRS